MGGASLPEGSVCSVGSVGIYSPTDFTDLHRWLGCVCSPTEFTEVLLRLFSHGIHRIHRSFVASHSSINLESVLWEGLLCQKVLCVPWVLWEYILPRISRICTDGLVASVLPRNSQKFGCVSPPTEFTEFTEVWGCCWLRGYGRMPYPPNLYASVPICGRYFSARRFCAFRGFCGRCFSARRFCVFCAFCGRYFSTKRVSSVGDYSFSMRKRLTMPKTRA